MERLKALLAESLKQNDSINKRLSVVAVLTEALQSQGIKPVIVGGFAVELWTMGSYATMDIDIIAEGISQAVDILYQLGFKNQGGVWTIPDSDIIIEFPKAPLDGDYQQVQPIETKQGRVYVLGLEDIILDRVSAAVFWKDQSSQEWAVFMIAAHYAEIDWDYLEKTAQEKGVSEAIKSFREEAAKIKE